MYFNFYLLEQIIYIENAEHIHHLLEDKLPLFLVFPATLRSVSQSVFEIMY
jgi:hypothetical protein